MRIAYVCGDRGIPVFGTKGASIHVRGMAQALAARGHEVHILSARSGGDRRDGFLPPVTDFGFDRLLKSLRQDIETQGDAPLAHETYALMLNGALAQGLGELDDKWGIQAIYERYSLWSWAGAHFARARNLPYILEVNAPLVREQQAWRELSLQPVAAAVERLVLTEADAISVPARQLRRHIAAVAGRTRGVHVLPNGVDLAVFRRPYTTPAALRECLRSRFVVAFLGSLKPWHGITELWRAFVKLRARVPEAHLLVIGDGPMRGFIDQAAASLAPGAVTLTGAVPHEQVPGLLSLADVGVAPYPALEEFYFCPLKVIEYMAAGLPVVASAIGDMPELVADGRTGLLVTPGDTRELTRALLELHGDPQRRAAFGVRARRRAETRFGWEVSARRVERLIERAVMRSKAPARQVQGLAGTA